MDSIQNENNFGEEFDNNKNRIQEAKNASLAIDTKFVNEAQNIGSSQTPVSAGKRSTGQKSTKVEEKPRYSFEDCKQDVRVPSYEEFYSSPIMKFIMFILSFFHIPGEIKPKNCPGKQEKIEVETITAENFKDKKYSQHVYNMFVNAFIVRDVLRTQSTAEDSITKDSKTKMYKIKGKEHNNTYNDKKPVLLLESSSQDGEDVDAFDKWVSDVVSNVKISSLKDIPMETLCDFLLLEVFNTSNLYGKLSDNKYTTDFDKLGFMYNPVDFDGPNFDNEEINKQYHELFNDKIIAKPSEVFARRAGIVKNSNLIISKKINSLVNTLSKKYNKIDMQNRQKPDLLPETYIEPGTNKEKKRTKAQREQPLVVYDAETFEYSFMRLLQNKHFRNVIEYAYPIHPMFNKVLSHIFDTPMFKQLLEKDDSLKPIAFLFTPYYFADNEFMSNLTNKDGKSKSSISGYTLQNRRKAMINMMIGNDVYNQKSNNFWTHLVDTTNVQNLWFDEEPQQKQTPVRRLSPMKQGSAVGKLPQKQQNVEQEQELYEPASDEEPPAQQQSQPRGRRLSQQTPRGRQAAQPPVQQQSQPRGRQLSQQTPRGRQAAQPPVQQQSPTRNKRNSNLQDMSSEDSKPSKYVSEDDNHLSSSGSGKRPKFATNDKDNETPIDY